MPRILLNKTIGLTSPNPKEATPSLRMLIAALWSRSRCVSHFGHCHSRSTNVSVSFSMVTNTTALCGGSPPPNLQHGADTLMRLMFEFPHKLTEAEVRDLFTPQAFHTRKIQVFKEQDVKATAQLYREFPMMIRSLVCCPFYECAQLSLRSRSELLEPLTLRECTFCAAANCLALRL